MKKRKKKNNKKTFLIVGSIAVAIIMLSILIQGISGNNNTTGGSNNDASGNWQQAFNSNEKQLFYLGRPSCSWCNKIRPGLNDLVEQYKIKSTYVNMDEIKSSEQNTIFEKLEIDTDNFGTPYLVVMENGKKIDEQIGYLPEDQLFSFFQRSGLIDANATYQGSNSIE